MRLAAGEGDLTVEVLDAEDHAVGLSAGMSMQPPDMNFRNRT